jgi:type I restriction enzyme S subunit
MICPTKRLGEVSEIEYGTRVVKSRNVPGAFYVYGGGGKTFTTSTYNRENCVIISRFGMSKNCVRSVSGKFFLNDSGLSVRAKDEEDLESTYLDWFLFASEPAIYSLGRGQAQKNLDVEGLKELRIPVPSLAEQRKIVAKIEKQFAKIDDAARLRAESQALTEQLLPAALHEIFSSAESRGWEEKEMGELLEIKHGYAFKSTHFNKVRGETLLTPGNFMESGGLYFNSKNTKRYDGGAPDGYVLKPGDLVVVMTDLSSQCKILGNPAFIEVELLHNQRIGKIILRNNQIFDRYLYYAFLSEPYKKYVRNTATGTTVRHTAPTRIYKVKIPLPPLGEQKKIVKKLGALSEKVRTLRELQAAQAADLKALKQSILHEAFAG